MKPIHSIKNVVVGSLLGSLTGFVVAYLVQAFFFGDATISNIPLLHVDTGTSRPTHQFSALYLAVKYINLVVGVSAGAVIGSIAGGMMSISQNLRAWTRPAEGIEDVWSMVPTGTPSNRKATRARLHELKGEAKQVGHEFEEFEERMKPQVDAGDR